MAMSEKERQALEAAAQATTTETTEDQAAGQLSERGKARQARQAG